MNRKVIFGLVVVLTVGFVWLVSGCISDHNSDSITTCKYEKVPLNITKLEEDAKAKGEDSYTVDLSKVTVRQVCTTTTKLPSGFCMWVKGITKS
jgi:hypothetical protein